MNKWINPPILYKQNICVLCVHERVRARTHICMYLWAKTSVYSLWIYWSMYKIQIPLKNTQNPVIVTLLFVKYTNYSVEYANISSKTHKSYIALRTQTSPEWHWLSAQHADSPLRSRQHLSPFDPLIPSTHLLTLRYTQTPSTDWLLRELVLLAYIPVVMPNMNSRTFDQYLISSRERSLLYYFTRVVSIFFAQNSNNVQNL